MTLKCFIANILLSKLNLCKYPKRPSQNITSINLSSITYSLLSPTYYIYILTISTNTII